MGIGLVRDYRNLQLVFAAILFSQATLFSMQAEVSFSMEHNYANFGHLFDNANDKAQARFNEDTRQALTNAKWKYLDYAKITTILAFLMLIISVSEFYPTLLKLLEDKKLGWLIDYFFFVSLGTFAGVGLAALPPFKNYGLVSLIAVGALIGVVTAKFLMCLRDNNG